MNSPIYFNNWGISTDIFWYYDSYWNDCVISSKMIVFHHQTFYILTLLKIELNLSIFKLPFFYFFPRRESVILGEDVQTAVWVQFSECVLVLTGISSFHPLIWRFLTPQPDIHSDSASSLREEFIIFSSAKFRT